MKNLEKALANLTSKGINSKIENDTIYVIIDDVELELSQYEIEYQAKQLDITETIKTVEDACEYLGEDDNVVVRLRAIEGMVRSFDGDEDLFKTTLATAQLEVVVKALNEKEVLDWNDSDVDKWFPFYYLNENNPRFCVSVYYSSRSCTCSRLCLKSKELSDYLASQFNELLVIHFSAM